MPGVPNVPSLPGVPSVPGIDTSGNVDINALLAQELDPSALNLVTPPIRNALASGYAAVNSLMPAYNLATKIASGGVPNEQETIAAMAGLATAINPIAGAAVLAAGEIAIGFEEGAEALLKGLGLISDYPQPVPYVGLIQKGKPLPAGPSDPLWIPWISFARWWYPPNEGGTATAWLPGLKGTPWSTGIPALSQGTGSLVIQNLMAAMKFTSPNASQQPGNSFGSALLMTPQPANGFEAFLIPVMQKNIEYWANANPYIDPRLLLGAAKTAWNQLHPPSSADITYHPAEYGSPQVDSGAFWVELLLGSSGDSQGTQRVKPLTVQMGPSSATIAASAPKRLSLAPAPPPAATSPAVKVAAGTAAVAGATVVGAAVYGYATGKALDAVFTGAWRALKGVFWK